MKLLMRLVVVLTLLTLATSCSTFRFPGVHRINIQQGNFITQQMIDKLKPGMSKNQIRYVLGQPVLENPLDQDRWDYMHTLQISGGKPQQAQLTLYFVNEHLDHFEGDYLPTNERARLQKQTGEENQISDAGIKH